MNPTFEFEVTSVNDLDMAAQALLSWATSTKIFCFYAPMGAGKTTFIKHLCKQLQYAESFSSPTFPIINDYGNIFHIDCYRLKNANEALQVGMDDCIHSGKYCFIEWAEIINELLPPDYIQIGIEITNQNGRKIIAKRHTK
jgi:tRNA threonylcarbamoyladenosine biosynthesis protein TsaE